MNGLSNLFTLDFWQEYSQMWQLVFHGDMPIYLFIILHLLLIIVFAMITSPIWGSYLLYKISKD